MPTNIERDPTLPNLFIGVFFTPMTRVPPTIRENPSLDPYLDHTNQNQILTKVQAIGLYKIWLQSLYFIAKQRILDLILNLTFYIKIKLGNQFYKDFSFTTKN